MADAPVAPPPPPPTTRAPSPPTQTHATPAGGGGGGGGEDGAPAATPSPAAAGDAAKPKPARAPPLPGAPSLTPDRFRCGNNVIADELVTWYCETARARVVLAVNTVSGFSLVPVAKGWALRVHLVTPPGFTDIGEWAAPELGTVFATAIRAWEAGMLGSKDPVAMKEGRPLKRAPSDAVVSAAIADAVAKQAAAVAAQGGVITEATVTPAPAAAAPASE